MKKSQASIGKIILIIALIFLVLWLFIKITHPFQPPEPQTPESKWLMPEDFNNQPAWGINNGIIISTWPGDLGGIGGGGPKGLFRIYKHGDKGLGWMNFLSLEPTTQNSLPGFSELESILFVPNPYANLNNPNSIIDNKLPASYDNLATITNENGIEQLNLLFGIENSFANNGHIYTTAHIRKDKPDEIEFRFYTHDDTAPIKKIRLSSTAGNFNHMKLLYLANEIIDSRNLYEGYQETGKRDFAPWTTFEFNKLKKLSDNSIIVATTRSADDPGEFWNDFFTRYELTQYFRKYPGSYDGNEFSAVNAKYVFWHTGKPIPGGVSYENFELNDPIFEQGQQIWFGATDKTPQELGF